MDRAAEQVRRFVAAHRLAEAPGVVGVSGGADSVALLRLLLDAGCRPVHVAHVNHQLRGGESDADEAFVRELAVTHGCEYHVYSVDVAALAVGANLEATARRARYDRFAEVVSTVGAGWVATGHTADDQAETVLHRLVRGTGLRGLRGIAATTADGLVRPLLTVTRTDVIEHLTALGQPFRDDATNAAPRFTRNRIRHELLPLLATFNPAAPSALAGLAEQAHDAFAVIETAADCLLTASQLPRASDLLVFDCDKLRAANPYLVREVFRLAWNREGWPAGRMTADHWHRLIGVVRGEATATEFPDGITARRVGRVVQLRRRV